MIITACRTNHLTNPLGYAMEKPVFSYVVADARGTRQTEARIEVFADAKRNELLYDSGWRKDLSPLAYEADIKLAPMTRYYWQVSVRTDGGDEGTSGLNWFETAKMADPWTGTWIGCDEAEKRHPIFVRTVEPKPDIIRARLYLCGLGVYEAYYGGQKIGDEWFAPYCNNYDSWLQYQTYDVTEQARKGGELAVALGKGWYLSRFGFDSAPGAKPFYGDRFRLIGELHLWHADGTEEVIGTDESWQVRRSQLLDSSLYDGEIVDGTLPELALVPAERIAPPKGQLTARYSIPVRAKQQLQPIALLHTPAGETVLDLGQNMAGSFRLRVHEPRGTKIHLQFGEILQNGCFYRDNLRTAKAEYIYISDGKEQELSARFVFYGYRYVKVEGVSALQAEDFAGLVLYSDMPETGRLKTGHAKVNQLIHNAEWGLRGNFIDVPTDCPQRDERMGWTGDAQVFSRTATFQHDTYAFYRKYLHDCLTEQQNRGGLVPNVIPAFGHNGTATVWGDAACIIPWNLYLYYGDLQILREQYGSMKAWVDYIRRTDGDNHHWREVFHFGDWLALDHPSGRVDESLGGTDEGFIADVYYRFSAQLTARAAALLGHEEDAKEYEALAEKILAGIREEFFSASGRCCIPTQTAAILTLNHGLTDRPQKAKEQLLKQLKLRHNKLATGFVGTPFLCSTLTDIGERELAYHLLLNEEYPGWLYEVNLGATTVWERWNSVMPDGSISSTGMNSLNHYAYGSIVEWIWRYAAGINPIEETPGFEKVRIAPQPGRKLGFLSAEYRSAAGTYRVFWEVLDNEHIRLEVTVPFGCEARLVLPLAGADVAAENADNPMFERVEDGACILGPGHYEVSYRTDRPVQTMYSVHNTVRELLDNPDTGDVVRRFVSGIDQIPDARKDEPLDSLLRKEKSDEAERLLRELADGLDAVNQE